MEDFFIFNLYQPAGLKMISDHETFRSHVTTNECLTLLLGQAATPWTPNNHNVLIMEGGGGGGDRNANQHSRGMGSRSTVPATYFSALRWWSWDSYDH